jgi:hypothetical protein
VLRDVAASVRAQRAPADPPDVPSDQLAGVVTNLWAVVDALRGPRLDDQRVLSFVRRLLPHPHTS